jgi:superfamily II RNA helicase
MEEKHKKPMKFKQFILDDFQIQAIKAIEHNHSVMVSAQTGTGKTLIADYIINKYIETDKRVIYTAPIKALSNQKYKDFKKSYGEDKVGLVTGDVVINSSAQILIMTTEIYRNMLVTRDKSVENISYIIFDEIHYINDIERGTVWEESVIFSPNSIRFLCLSATVPNAREFAHWIETIKEHKVEVVQNEKRAVPLLHQVFEAEHGLKTIKELKELADIPDYNKVTKGKNRNRGKKHFVNTASHLDVIEEIEHDNLFPAIYFIFSRAACQKKAVELARKKNFAKKGDVATILSLYNQYIKDDLKRLASSIAIKSVIQKGIAIHHAGLLPKQKELVEELFERGLISVLYATETFAVGINMPAKCVIFNSLYKYDGISFRYLNSKEYFQLAGRAGRRGIDKEGTAIALIDMRKDKLDKIARFTAKDTEPITSRFNLSYNTALNLLHRYSENEIEFVLKSSFDYYLRKKQKKNIRIMSSFKHRVQSLQKLGFVKKDKSLTEKGRFAMYIYAHEIAIAEIFCSDFYKDLTDGEIILTIASIMFEGRRGVEYERVSKKQNERFNKKLRKCKVRFKQEQMNNFKNLSKIIYRWVEGGTFEEILSYATMQEGDYIRIFRQTIDMLRQIKRATNDFDLGMRVDDCIKQIDRSIIAIEF